MSGTKVETRHLMETNRIVSYSSPYTSHHRNGLIKSASTSSCSASENALLRSLRASRYATNSKKRDCAADVETATAAEPHKLFVLQPLSYSAQNVPLLAAAEADSWSARKSNLCGRGGRSWYDGAKVARSATAPTSFGDHRAPNFSSHRNLDIVLIGQRDNSAIINFTTVNDVGANGGRKSNGNGDARNRDSGGAAPSPSGRGRENGAPDSEMAPSSTSAQQPANVNNDSTAAAAVCATAPASSSVASAADDVSVACGETSPPKEEKSFRRSSSLKMRKESTESPAQKKIVRFADAMGLDLTDVRTFLDELPSVPRSAYNDLCAGNGGEPELTCGAAAAAPPPFDRLFGGAIAAPLRPTAAPPAKSATLVPMFKQPGLSLNFLERIRDAYVCLEKAVVSSQPVCSVAGTVRVRNIDFHKSVYVRYTLDNWRSYAEMQAVYVPSSCDGFSDQFSFIIYLYDLPSSQRLEMAVRYHCSGSIYWDNNSGANYVFQSTSSPPTVPSYFACVPNITDRCQSFY